MASHANTLVTWCEELTHWKRPWCWERWRAGGKGGNRGWDGWMASPTQWTRVWVNSRRQWRTGKPAVCSPWGCRVRHALLTEQLQHGYLIVSVCFFVVSVLCRKGSGVFLTGSTAPLLLIDHLTPCGASWHPWVSSALIPWLTFRQTHILKWVNSKGTWAKNMLGLVALISCSCAFWDDSRTLHKAVMLLNKLEIVELIFRRQLVCKEALTKFLYTLWEKLMTKILQFG